MKSIAMAGMVLLIFATYCHCEEFNPFCYERFDGLRKMQFWGEAKILISDYDRNSGDAYALKLIKGKEGLPNDSITDYFNNGFVRLIKGSHPYVNVEEGSFGREIEARENYEKIYGPGALNKSYGSFKRAFELSEKERIDRLYGRYPARIYCWVGVKRRATPVLYQVRTSIYDSLDIYDDDKKIQEEFLDYSTPNNIEEDIKKAITLNLENLSKKLILIRKCNSN